LSSTHFLFQEGEWKGTGRVTFSVSPEVLQFITKWTVTSLGNQRFRAVQKVEIPGQEMQTNVFTITKQPSGEFQLFLENEVIGVFSGEGVSDDKRVAWEFTHHGTLEGMEVYEKTSDNEYSFRAEYIGGDDYSTSIHGTISKAAKDVASS
jgi:hypothetical protein